MKKYIILVLLIITASSTSDAAISFTDGKWETTFDCSDVTQAGTLACDGTVWGGDWTFTKLSMSDGSTNKWTRSTANNLEYYYNHTLTGVDVKEVYVGGVRFKVTGTSNNPVGSLLINQYNTGDNDSLGYTTVYIRSDIDPDSQANDYVYAWIGHSSYVSGDYSSSITSAANNPSGKISSKGFRVMTADGITVNSGPLGVEFPTSQTELWIRWYMRHESGYTWAMTGEGRVPYNDKHVYLYAGGTEVIVTYYYDEYGFECQGTPSAWQLVTTGDSGWPTIMGGDPSDGEWHCYEAYLKMDTNQTDGVGKIWIDGVLKASSTTMNYSAGNADSLNGWEYFRFGSNQGTVDNGGAVMYKDFDDLVVYNTTPPNQDAFGNYFIGPIDTPSAPVVDILTASGQTTTASVFTITGTATVDTGQTISGVTCSGQTVTPDDGTWDEQAEAFTCLANLALGENTLVFIGSDGTRTGSDTVVVTRTEIKTSRINGQAVIKGAVIH